MPERLVIGTVQFGMPYGRRRAHGLISIAAMEAILDAAWELGIRAFDTAEAYGEAAPRLAAWLQSRGHLDRAEIITKVQLHGRTPDPGTVRAAVERFAGAARITVLSHELCLGEAWTRLLDLTRAFDARAGQSLYEIDDLNRSIHLPGMSRIQFPGSIVTRASLDACPADHVTAFDFRSAFLQGLLLEPPERAESRVPGSRWLVEMLQRAAARAGNELPELLIGSVLARRPRQDRVVLGMDDAEQVAAIGRALELPHASVATFIQEFDEQVEHPLEAALIDPRLW